MMIVWESEFGIMGGVHGEVATLLLPPPHIYSTLYPYLMALV